MARPKNKIDIDLLGRKFGKLLIIENGFGFERTNSDGFHWTPSWIAQCECGNEVEVDHYKVLSNHTRSCGCLVRKHGMSASREYMMWASARSRCYFTKNASYARYGGRGIKMSSEWDDFANFIKDMGKCPKGHSLGRINNDGDYCKENCRWETTEQQQNNKSNSTKFEHLGQILTIAQLARMYSVSKAALRYRLLDAKLSVEEAIKTLKENK